MPPIFAMIISNKLATLKELKEYYTYSEALDMLDIILTNSYNERIIQENNKDK